MELNFGLQFKLAQREPADTYECERQFHSVTMWKKTVFVAICKCTKDLIV